VTDPVTSIMDEFAAATGLTTPSPPRRYLWTDAHAVCNFLTLHRRSGDARQLDLAAALVDQVHRVLGRHRPDDARRGWISGLGEQEGARHPTAGGLRIGKPLPERQPGEPYDARLEWDRDGQYFHYLTKWMHALNAMAAASGDAQYRRWAEELALAGHRGFRAGPPERPVHALYWKMSIDLSRPLVASSGQHDPLDGLITCLVLRAHRPAADTGNRNALDEAIAELAAQCSGRDWFTDDPLGVGGLLFDVGRLAQLEISGHGRHVDDLMPEVIAAAVAGTRRFLATPTLSRSGRHRLAFRELGFAIGLHAARHVLGMAALPAEQHHALSDLADLTPAAGLIEQFWLEQRMLNGSGWNDHKDINDVMLATSLAPDVFLTI
jgi:hypothetical protein